MADHWLDGGPALDLLRDAALFAGRVDPAFVIGQGIVTAIAGIGDDALEHVADQRSMTGMAVASVCPVARICRAASPRGRRTGHRRKPWSIEGGGCAELLCRATERLSHLVLHH